MTLPSTFEAWVIGLTFLPLLVCSVVGSAITLAKWLELRRHRVRAGELVEIVRPFVERGEYGRAEAAVRGREAARRFLTSLLGHAARSTETIKDRAVQLGSQLARELEYGLGGLALIATLGPLFGLFGTVIGIVLVFNRLSLAEGIASPQQIAGGIGTALYTTIVGLIVGILALVSHRVLAARVDRLLAEIETIGVDLLELVTGERR